MMDIVTWDGDKISVFRLRHAVCLISWRPTEGSEGPGKGSRSTTAPETDTGPEAPDARTEMK